MRVGERIRIPVPYRYVHGNGGLSRDQVDQLLVWEMGILHASYSAKIAAPVGSVRDNLEAKLEERGRRPRENLPALIVTAEINGRPATQEEQMGMGWRCPRFRIARRPQRLFPRSGPSSSPKHGRGSGTSVEISGRAAPRRTAI